MDNIITPNEIVFTEEQKVIQAVNFNKEIIAGVFTDLKTGFEKTFNFVWHNPVFTPQQIFNGYGTDAHLLFSVAQKTVELLTLIDPAYTAPVAPKTFTINSDGSVTVN